MTNDHDVEIAVLTERFDQLRNDHAQLAASIRDLSRSVAALERAVAAQSPIMSIIQHALTATVSAGIAWWASRKG